jgi:hypothetical protein
MAREMRFLDIPDGHPLPGKWLIEIRSEEFEKHISVVEHRGAALAALDVDCKIFSGSMWRLRLLIGFGNAHHLIFVPVRDGNLLAVHGFTGNASEMEHEEIAIAQARIRDLM